MENGKESINQGKMHKNYFFSFKNLSKLKSTDNSPYNTTITTIKL